jgi:hypothetical protein
MARTFYIAAAGNDGHDGLSPATAWQTVGKVNGFAQLAGDMFLFHGGDTFSGTTLGLTTSGTSFSSYGAGNATISVSAAQGCTGTNLSNISISNLNFVGAGGTTVAGVHLVYSSGASSNVILSGLSVSGFPSDGIDVDCRLGGTLTGVSILNCVSFNNTFGDTGKGSIAGIQIEGNYFGDDGSHYNIFNATIDHCVAHHNSGTSPPTSWAGTGIVIGKCNGGVISNCLVHDNGVNGFSNVGIFIVGDINCTATQCEAYNTFTTSGHDGIGFDIDGGCINCTIEYCYSHANNVGYSFFQYSDGHVSAWQNNTIRYCIAEANVSADFYINLAASTSMTGAQLYGNTMYSTSLLGMAFVGASGAMISGNVIDNILMNSGIPGAALLSVGAGLGVNFYGNDYYSLGSFSISWGANSYTSFAAWQAASGQELLSSGTNTLYQSNTFSTGYWAGDHTGISAVVDNATLAPDGTTTAASLTENLANSNHKIGNATTPIPVVNGVLTYTIYVKPAGRTWIWPFIGDGTFTNYISQYVNLSGAGSLGTVVTGGTGVISSVTVTPVANGFYKVTLTGTIGGATSAFIYMAFANGDTVQTYTGSGALAGYVWGASITAPLAPVIVGKSNDPQLKNPGNGGIVGGYAPPLPVAYQLQPTSPMLNAGLNMQALFGINPGQQDYYGNTLNTAKLSIGANCPSPFLAVKFDGINRSNQFAADVVPYIGGVFEDIG